MNANTKPFHIDVVTAGMTLSDDVLGERGDLIVAQGVVLTEALIAALRRRGLEMLPIVDPAAVAVPESQPSKSQQEQLALLFRHFADRPANQHLLRLVTQYRAGSPT